MVLHESNSYKEIESEQHFLWPAFQTHAPKESLRLQEFSVEHWRIVSDFQNLFNSSIY